jgi:starch phosphorylase
VRLSGVESLTELALDLRWAWNHSADELWAELEPELWALTHNPWVVLQTVARARLEAFLARPEYRRRLETLLDLRRQHLGSAAWFQQSHPEARLTRVAYFSMESRVADGDLWALRAANRKALVEYARERTARDLASIGAPAEQVARAEKSLDPDALTLGFARRFATYKRPTLLLHSPERLLRILTDPDRPVQLVIAGKAHPADQTGQAMIADWFRFIRRPDVEGRVVFIPDYDLLVAERLVQGVDLWINTPRRPWEASGTSGMKVLVNGGLNLSELDGWWAEAYAPEVGWALGDGREHDDDPGWDAAEAEALYALLEREIVPAFYTRDGHGMPTAWLAKMRESMARLTPRFSTNRVVREYTERYYLPAAGRYRNRAADKGALGARLLAWERHLSEHWHEARFGALRVMTCEGRHRFSVEVYLGRLDPEALRVELFADALNGGAPACQPMARGRRLDAPDGGHEYTADVPVSRPAGDYTPRLVPYHPEAAVPLEATEILWQR